MPFDLHGERRDVDNVEQYRPDGSRERFYHDQEVGDIVSSLVSGFEVNSEQRKVIMDRLPVESNRWLQERAKSPAALIFPCSPALAGPLCGHTSD
jgi:hypothetical protein